MTRPFAAAALLLAAAPLQALEVGTSDFVYASDLVLDGFTPFATGAVNAVFGMQKDSDMYLCFVADTSDNAAVRQQKLLAELQSPVTDRSVPNIPVVCILTQ